MGLCPGLCCIASSTPWLGKIGQQRRPRTYLPEGAGCQRSTQHPCRSYLWRRCRDAWGSLRDSPTGCGYLCQLIAKTQLKGESLQEFATVLKQVAHWAPIGLPKHFIHREAAYVLVDGIRDRKVKQQLLMNGDRISMRPWNWKLLRRPLDHPQGCETLEPGHLWEDSSPQMSAMGTSN
jgi:hypothetical protein